MYPSHIPQQVAKDNSLIQVSQKFPGSCSMLEFPVYFSEGVWELSQANDRVIYNICYLAASASVLVSKSDVSSSTTTIFSVIVEGAERKPDFMYDEKPYFDLATKIPAKKSDDSVIIIVFPDEINNLDLSMN